jgi:hypothetical protein
MLFTVECGELHSDRAARGNGVMGCGGIFDVAYGYRRHDSVRCVHAGGPPLGLELYPWGRETAFGGKPGSVAIYLQNMGTDPVDVQCTLKCLIYSGPSGTPPLVHIQRGVKPITETIRPNIPSGWPNFMSVSALRDAMQSCPRACDRDTVIFDMTLRVLQPVETTVPTDIVSRPLTTSVSSREGASHAFAAALESGTLR